MQKSGHTAVKNCLCKNSTWTVFKKARIKIFDGCCHHHSFCLLMKPISFPLTTAHVSKYLYGAESQTFFERSDAADTFYHFSYFFVSSIPLFSRRFPPFSKNLWERNFDSKLFLKLFQTRFPVTLTRCTKMTKGLLACWLPFFANKSAILGWCGVKLF